MYSIELIDIIHEIPNISKQNLSNIDGLLGSIGTGGIFRKSELLRILTQKRIIDKVEKFLIEKQIIEPFKICCSICGREFPADIDNCDNCGSEIVKHESITYYKVVSEINLSDIEKKSLSQKNKELDISAFKLLVKKIDRIIRKNEEGYLLLFDLANSTELNHIDKYTHSFICKYLISYIKEITRPFFLKSNAIVVKSEGDSSFVFFTNLEDMKQFMKDFSLNIRYQEFYKKIVEFNSSNKVKVFLKGYCANSDILEYHQTDMLSLDFESMEAFTFIKRIEKEGKRKLLEDYKEIDLFPFFLLSRTEYFKSKMIELNDIQNYKTVEVYLSFATDIETQN